MGLTEGLLFVVCVLVMYLTASVVRVGRYWKELGVASTRPLFLVGDLLPLILQRKSLGQIHKEIYKRFPREKFVGFFNFIKPTLLVRDPDLCHSVLVKNFSHFTDRSFPPDESRDPLSANLFALTGTRWKAVRTKVAPTFTTCKLKEMISQITDCWDLCTQEIDKSLGSEIEIKPVTTMFTLNVIASTAFGLDPRHLGDPNSEFRRMAKKMFEFDLARIVKFLLVTNLPWIASLLKLRFIPKDVGNYFGNLMMDTMEYRRKNKVERNDFVQLMMQVRDKGSVDVTTWDAEDEYLGLDDKVNTETVVITDNILKSNALVFFIAGFESGANTLLYALFELSQQPHLLEQVTMETAAVLHKNNGVYSYEALKEMVLLEMCIKETMRLHPIVFSLVRRCTKKCNLSGLNVEAGTTIVVPALALHTDPAYWPDPLSFNPERFRPGTELKPGTYLPFGDGPRICIAMRFAMLEVKLGLSKMLLSYRVKLNPRTEIPIRFNLRSFINNPVSPVFFNLEKRQVALA